MYFFYIESETSSWGSTYIHPTPQLYCYQYCKVHTWHLFIYHSEHELRNNLFLKLWWKWAFSRLLTVISDLCSNKNSYPIFPLYKPLTLMCQEAKTRILNLTDRTLKYLTGAPLECCINNDYALDCVLAEHRVIMQYYCYCEDDNKEKILYSTWPIWNNTLSFFTL